MTASGRQLPLVMGSWRPKAVISHRADMLRFVRESRCILQPATARAEPVGEGRFCFLKDETENE